MSGSIIQLQRKDQRKQMLKQRRALDQDAQDRAALLVAQQFLTAFRFKRLNKLASYVPVRGELSPHRILRAIQCKNISIPVITDLDAGLMKLCQADHSQLAFPVPRGISVRLNGYGIPEPTVSQKPENPKSFDVILMPLVAFDSQGNRLGMGAGFYDRMLAFKRWLPNINRPTLVGLAHDFQQVDFITSEYWDIPLDVIITPSTIIWPKRAC